MGSGGIGKFDLVVEIIPKLHEEDANSDHCMNDPDNDACHTVLYLHVSKTR